MPYVVAVHHHWTLLLLFKETGRVCLDDGRFEHRRELFVKIGKWRGLSTAIPRLKPAFEVNILGSKTAHAKAATTAQTKTAKAAHGVSLQGNMVYV